MGNSKAREGTGQFSVEQKRQTQININISNTKIFDSLRRTVRVRGRERNVGIERHMEGRREREKEMEGATELWRKRKEQRDAGAYRLSYCLLERVTEITVRKNE